MRAVGGVPEGWPAVSVSSWVSLAVASPPCCTPRPGGCAEMQSSCLACIVTAPRRASGPPGARPDAHAPACPPGSWSTSQDVRGAALCCPCAALGVCAATWKMSRLLPHQRRPPHHLAGCDTVGLVQQCSLDLGSGDAGFSAGNGDPTEQGEEEGAPAGAGPPTSTTAARVVWSPGKQSPPDDHRLWAAP